MWKTNTLGEVCDEVGGIIQTGPFGSQLHESDYVEDGIPVVMPKNIIDGKIDTGDIAFIKSEDADRLARHKMSVGDIVYGRRGDIGRRAIVSGRENGWICGTGCLRVSLGNRVLNPRYLYYFLGQPMVVSWIANQAVGATMPNLNTGILRSVEVRYPRLPIQCRIASVLAAYDDLIENNTRRIKILEEMAQMLYREWFVDFRYPGHEMVKMVDSELGPIPKQWSAPALESLLEHAIGGGWGEEAESDQCSVRAYVIRGTDIPGARHGDVTNCPLRWHKDSNHRSRQLRCGDLVFEVSGGSKGQPVGRSLLIGDTLLSQFDRSVICASFCKLLRPKSQSGLATALYLFLREAYTNGVIEKFQVQSTGISNFKFTAFVGEVRIPLPDPTTLEQFGNVVQPMLEALAVFGKRNANLRTTRDLLLPKLISGEIPVEAADETATELMEATA